MPRKLFRFLLRSNRQVHAPSLAGVIWIDEQARDVVRLEAYFAENLKLGGGLVASLQKGSSFAFSRPS